MSTTDALTVSRMATAGYGWENICAALRIPINSADGREVRKYVLGLGSQVAKRYGT